MDVQLIFLCKSHQFRSLKHTKAAYLYLFYFQFYRFVWMYVQHFRYLFGYSYLHLSRHKLKCQSQPAMRMHRNPGLSIFLCRQLSVSPVYYNLSILLCSFLHDLCNACAVKFVLPQKLLRCPAFAKPVVDPVPFQNCTGLLF